MQTDDLQQRRIFLTTLAGLALASLTGCGGGGGAAPGTSNRRTPLLIPAYFIDPLLWAKILPAHNPAHCIIANVSSGPGLALDPIWPPRFQQAKLNGHQLVGYVDTTFAVKTVAAAQAEIALWASLYGIQDIFLDQVSGTAVDLAYYTSLVSGIRAINPSARIILNVGAIPDPRYFQFDTLTEVVLFENTWLIYQTVTFPAWLNSYWGRVHLIVHTAPVAALVNVNSFAGAHTAAGYFVTDQTTASYTLNLPSYWSNELAL